MDSDEGIGMRTYRGQKAALTRAMSSGTPEDVIKECDRFFAEYDDADLPYPDDWHRWNIARLDARMKLVYA